MPRLPRYVLPGHPQHVIQRGNNRSAIFAAEEDYGRFRHELIEACRRYESLIHAYVFMTNHVHLIMTPMRKESISKVLQSVGRRYVQYFNYAYQRTGTLWEGRYKATLIDTERYLLTCYRYIELNPVRANMVTHPGERAERNPIAPHVSLHSHYITANGAMGLHPTSLADVFQGKS